MVQHSNDDLVLETREKAGKYSESRITITETLDNWRLKLLIIRAVNYRGSQLL